MANPMLNEARWDELSRMDRAPARATTMTVNGTVGRAGMLLVLLGATIAGMWYAFWPSTGVLTPALLMPAVIGGGLIGFLLVLVTGFAPRIAPVTAPLYAVAKGAFLGGLTIVFQARYPGLPVLAAVCTAGVLGSLLVLYRIGVIRVSDRFIRGVMIATIGAVVAIGALWLLSLFSDAGRSAMAALGGSGWIGIGFSLLMIALAAANLVVDFAVIERGARQGLPRHMEWFAAMGLLVTLVWLYLEILILLAKLRGRE